MRARDRVIGIVIGILIGIGIVTAFVFLGSEQTVDAPRLNSGAQGSATTTAAPPPRSGSKRTAKAPPVATVRVASGAPPASGPAHLDYRAGQRVRLRVRSDETLRLELLGYGIAKTVAADLPTPISFTASRQGNFPLIVSTSHIAVAQIRVGGRP
jgi:hypothetical protein